jgi:hypothetical protein
MEIWHVFFSMTMSPRAVSLLFCLLKDPICRRSLQRVCVYTVKRKFVKLVCGFFLLLPLGCFFGLGDGTDKLYEPVSITLGRDRGYLGLGVCNALEKVLHTFDE